VLTRLKGYWRRLAFEYSQWRWRRHFNWCHARFKRWSEEFKTSEAQVLLGAHLHLHGGVRNHLLAIARYSTLKTVLVPSERDLQRWGSAPFAEHRRDFLKVCAPESVVAVHTHVLPWLIDWARCHRSDRLRWVHTHHLLYYPESGKGGLEPWQEDLNAAMLGAARDADVCLCVSKWEQQVLRDRYGIESAYLPNGVDVDSCDQAVGARFCRRWRTRPGFVLWVGRMDHVKNPGEFVRLAAMTPQQQFVMIGGVTASDVEQELGLTVPTNLKLLPQLPHHQTLDALQAAGVVVVTSFREGLPTLVLEAMALQKQIVVPEEPGCLDATDGPQHAGVYRHGDLQSLRTLVQHRCGQLKPAVAARERVLREFDWRVIAAKLDRIYLEEKH
jgi:glycosyltransferase involved in cell wall biosynthesis